MTGARSQPIFTRAFLLVSLASLGYFMADGISLALVARFVTGPLGGDALAAGVAYGAFSVSALLLRPASGRLSDRLGRRPLMVAGTLLFGAVMLAHLLATSVAIVIGLRVLLGVAEALVFVSAFAAEADLAPPDRRGEALTFFSLSLYAGIAFGPLIGEAAFDAGGFPAVWVAAAAMAAFAAVLAALVPETRLLGEPTAVTTPRRGLHRWLHPAGLLPGVILMTGVWGMGGYFVLMPPYAVDVLGLDGARGFLLLFGMTVIVARIVGARLPDRLGARRVSGTALLVSALGLTVMAGVQSAVGLAAGSVLLGLGVAYTTPALGALTVARAPASERGEALGTFSVFIDVAFGAGPIAMGAVAGAAGAPASFLSAAAVAIGGYAVLAARLREVPPEPLSSA